MCRIPKYWPPFALMMLDLALFFLVQSLHMITGTTTSATRPAMMPPTIAPMLAELDFTGAEGGGAGGTTTAPQAVRDGPIHNSRIVQNAVSVHFKRQTGISFDISDLGTRFSVTILIHSSRECTIVSNRLVRPTEKILGINSIMFYLVLHFLCHCIQTHRPSHGKKIDQALPPPFQLRCTLCPQIDIHPRPPTPIWRRL